MVVSGYVPSGVMYYNERGSGSLQFQSRYLPRPGPCIYNIVISSGWCDRQAGLLEGLLLYLFTASYIPPFN